MIRRSLRDQRPSLSCFRSAPLRAAKKAPGRAAATAATRGRTRAAAATAATAAATRSEAPRAAHRGADLRAEVARPAECGEPLGDVFFDLDSRTSVTTRAPSSRRTPTG